MRSAGGDLDTMDRVLLAVVVAIAAALAAALFVQSWANDALLWRDFYHDRNTHLARGLDYAVSLRTLDIPWFLVELDKAQVWPPLHGLVLSGVLLVGGIDHRLGVVPSLIGWATTVVCVWLIVRHFFADRVIGTAAATTAATLTAASPALRLLGADVMLESLGSALSALCVLLFMRASAKPDAVWRWRLLALTLCALFLHKTNYWGLVLVSLVLAVVLDDVAGLRTRALSLLIGVRWRSILRDAIRHPLVIAGLLVALFALVVFLRGPTVIPVFGRNVNVYPPGIPTTIAYALLFGWVVLQWLRRRAAFDAALGPTARALYYWHLVPVALYFLLPKRLPAFLWFVGPYNNQSPGFHPLSGALLYWDAFARGFHVAEAVAVGVLALALAGAVLAARRSPPGGKAVLLLVLVSSAAVIIHPQHQGRFLASWIFAVWVLAGIGSGALLAWLTRLLGRRVARAFAVAAVGALVLTSVLKSAPSEAAYRHAIRPTAGPSDLDLVRPYIAELDGARSVMFATTMGNSDLFRWMLRERCRCLMTITHPWIDYVGSREEVRARMAERVAATPVERIVLIDAPGSGTSHGVLGWTYGNMAGVVDAMEAQTRFERVSTHALPRHGARASVWRRRE